VLEVLFKGYTIFGSEHLLHIAMVNHLPLVLELSTLALMGHPLPFGHLEYVLPGVVRPIKEILDRQLFLAEFI
jgi:hypothetical protein